jgi:anti-sigma factor RsiW
MKTINKTRCGQIRGRLLSTIASRLNRSAWMQNHIASCPRCQKRLAAVAKVDIALSLIKAQRHDLDLLSRANAQAIGVLKHSLRYATKAQKLKVARPEPKLWERCSKYTGSIGNVAACVTILCLMKIGIFSSMDKFQNEGTKAMKQYYAAQAGQDIADEIFPA